MPVYQVTFKSGAQQFMEMDMDDANYIAKQMADYARWEDLGRRGGEAQLPSRVYTSSCGASLDVSEVAGFQHYITKGYAEQRSNEDGGTADFNDAIDAAIQAMMDTAEVEGSEPNAYVAAVDGVAVRAAFLGALGRE